MDALVLWVKLHKADILENSGRLQKALGILNTRSKDLSDVCRRLCNILTGPHDPFSCLTSLEFVRFHPSFPSISQSRSLALAFLPFSDVVDADRGRPNTSRCAMWTLSQNSAYDPETTCCTSRRHTRSFMSSLVCGSHR